MPASAKSCHGFLKAFHCMHLKYLHHGTSRKQKEEKKKKTFYQNKDLITEQSPISLWPVTDQLQQVVCDWWLTGGRLF